MSVLARAGTVICAALVLVGCGAGEHDPKLIAPTHGEDPPWFGLTNTLHKANVPYVLRNEFRVCLDRPGQVEIIDLAFEHTFGGLRIDDFGVQDVFANPDLGHGDVFSSLPEHGFEPGPVIVDIACPLDQYGPLDDHVPNAALGIELSKPTDATAGGRELIITYQTPSGKNRELIWPSEFILCEGDFTSEECEHYPD